MTAHLARHAAAQAKAAEVVAAVAEAPDGGRLLRVAVTDPETNTRLATCFVTYQTGAPVLRLVEETP